jgi:glycosyltransferase involved in cell wall biosynthesis
MTGTADVSVIIPVFNSGVTAIAAIESVLSQTVRVREIVVVDDGSIDGSGRLVAERFLGTADLVKVFRIDNVGAAGARNHGISRANSTYVAFLDSDDVWMPTKLERQLGVIDDVPSVGMVGTQTTMGAKFIEAELGRRTAKLVVVSSTMQLFKNFFQTSTVLVRRSVLDSVGHFPTAQRYAEEGDLFIRIAAHSRCILLNEVLVDYCGGKGGFGEAGLSANLNAMEHGELSNIRRALQRGNCGLIVFLAATLFSILKFARRKILRTLRPAMRRISA